ELEVEHRRVEDDRPAAGRQLRSGQELDGLLGVLLRMPGQIQAADVLVARRLKAAARVRIAAPLVLVAFDGVRLNRSPDLSQDLLGEAAVRRGEGLPLAMTDVHRF